MIYIENIDFRIPHGEKKYFSPAEQFFFYSRSAAP